MNKDNLGYKYNRFILLLIAISPFLSIFSEVILNIEWNYVMIVLSFIGVAFIFIFKDDYVLIRLPRYLIFYFLFSLYLYYSAFIQLDGKFQLKYIYSSKMLGAVNMFFIIENITIPKKYLNRLLNLSIMILVIAFLVILYQELIDGSFLMLQDESVDSTFLGPREEYRLKSIYSYLGYLTFGLGFLPILLWIIETLDNRKKNIVFWVLIGFIYVFLTRARWLMVNSFTILFVLLVHQKNKIFNFIKYTSYLIILVLMSYQILNLVGVDTKSIIENRILEKNRRDDAKSAGTRIFAFMVFNKLYWDNPIFGAGDQKYGMGGTGKHDYKLRSLLADRSAQIHVGYLALLYKYGLIGGILFLGFLYNLLKELYLFGRKFEIWAPFFGVIGFALVNFTQVYFSFFELGLIFMMVIYRYYNQTECIKISNL